MAKRRSVFGAREGGRLARLAVKEHEGPLWENEDGLYSEWWYMYVFINLSKYTELSRSTFVYESYTTFF